MNKKFNNNNNKACDGKDFKSGKKTGSSNKKRPNRRSTSKAKDPATATFNNTDEHANNPAWYASDPSLARDSASIPFSWSTGVGDDLGIPTGIASDALQNMKYVAPGANVIYLRSSVGDASDPTSPINIAANAMYSFVRHANSGSANYDAPDLMCYILGMGDIIAMLNFAIRLYGTASVFSSRNRYLPKAIIEAQNVDYTDLMANLAQFRYGLNLFVNKLTSFALPANMPYFKRKAFLYSGIYTEGTSAKDQMYLYAPAAYYMIGTDNDGATCLNTVNFYNPFLSSATKYKHSDILNILNGMLDPYVYSEDFNIMSGDILKAYGEGGILKFGRVDTDFSMGITFDIGVLEQMKNATLLPLFYTEAGLAASVHQNTTKGWLIAEDNTIVLDQSTTAINNAGFRRQLTAMNRVLTTTTKDVSPELVLESTRLMTGAGRLVTTSQVTMTAFSGTEIAIGATVVYLQDGVTKVTGYSTFGDPVLPSNSVTQNSLVDSYLQAFKFAPNPMHITYTAGSTNLLTSIQPWIGYDNYAILTSQDLRRMHEACLLNMLRVPAIGSAFSS